jgi:hypothetical protein
MTHRHPPTLNPAKEDIALGRTWAQLAPRTFRLRQAWLDAIAERIQVNGIGHDDLLFPTRAGTPISRNTFRTRIRLPRRERQRGRLPRRVHDLRHAHASWLLAGGADLVSVMERMGHSQIQTPRNTFTPSPTPTSATSTHSTLSSTDSRDRAAPSLEGRSWSRRGSRATSKEWVRREHYALPRRS